MKLPFCKLISVFASVLLFVSFSFAQTERENGIRLYEQGEYEKAVVALQKAIEANKENRNSWLYLGMSYAKLKKDREAVAAFGEANKLPKKEAAENETNLKITSRSFASYTDSARQNRIQGIVKLSVEFGADDKIKDIFAFQKLSEGLTEASIEAAQKIKFESAKKDGKPVTTIAIIEYAFTLH